MNKIFFILIILNGFTTWACPNLAGRFVCSNSANEKIPVIITQTTANDVVIYNYDYKYQNMKPYDAITDGVFKKVEFDDFKGVQKYSCVENSVEYVRTGKHYQHGKAYASSQLQIVDLIDAGGNLQSTTHLILKNYDQEKPTELNYKETCLRN